MCGIYESTCKILCSKIDEENICKNIRSNDCFWMNKNESNPSKPNTQCVDKVYFLIFFFFLI
jgi:hypothetical protein